MTLDEAGVGIVHHFAGAKLYAKEMHVNAGLVIAQHKHKFDHLSLLVAGDVEIEVDGVRSRHSAPACITITAGKHHGVKALTDVIWYCIHSTDCVDAAEIDEALILPSNPLDMQRLAEGML